MGSVNKVSLFDKDVMVLAIFGLRGFNHEGEVAGCLKCGYNIMEACCSLEGVISVSVGVTTGTEDPYFIRAHNKCLKVNV